MAKQRKIRLTFTATIDETWPDAGVLKKVPLDYASDENYDGTCQPASVTFCLPGFPSLSLIDMDSKVEVFEE